MSNQVFKSKLARHFVIMTILFSSLITLLITASQLHSDYKYEIRKINSGINTVLKTHLNTLVTSIWVFDKVQILSILKGIKNSPGIEVVEVMENGKTKWKAGVLKSNRTIIRTVALEIIYKNKKVVLGKLKLTAGLNKIYRLLWDRVIFILVTNAFKTFLVAGFMLFLVYYYISRHISMIADHLENQSADKPWGLLALDRNKSTIKKGGDELDLLVKTINNLHTKLEKSISNLRVSEERFQHAVAGSSEGIWDWDIKSSTNYFSPRFIELLGHSEGDEFPHTLDNFRSRLHPEDKEHANECLRQHLEENIPYEVEFRLRLKNGEYRWFLARGLAVRDENNQPIRMAGSISDIHARKLIESEILKYRDRLEELVNVRTAELVKSRNDADKANAAKSEFLSRMSHELRTPMNAILGFGQMLELDAEDLSETNQRNVAEILTAGHHLLELINEVLDIARIESGEISLTMQKVAIDDVVVKCIALISTEAKARQIDIVDKLSSNKFLVNADHTRLKQVLSNLLSNAVKYNREKGSIVLEGEIIDNQRLRIRISDEGKGLTDEQMLKLFSPFERLDALSSIEGTGIGLVISRNLMQSMGGTIGVESIQGKGSVFWLDIAIFDENKNSGMLTNND